MVRGQSIAVLGGNGFIGQNLVNFFSQDNTCISISKDNYNELKTQSFDIFINANGNSSKRLPESDPLLDFDLSVRSTLKSIVDYNYKTYIYLSSCEVYEDLSSQEVTKENILIKENKISRYGLSKYLSECIVRNYCKNWLILRLNGPIGLGMKKGPIFDILSGQKLWLSQFSKFQVLHVDYISQFVDILLHTNITNRCFNVCGSSSISLTDVMSMLNKIVGDVDQPVILHDIDIESSTQFMKFPTSSESIERLRSNYGH